MPVFIYRMMQYTLRDEIHRQFGKDKQIEIFRNAGEAAGIEFAKNMLDTSLPKSEFLTQLQQVLEESKLGVLRIEHFDDSTGEVTLTIGEDLDCSSLPVTGETICNYDEGFLAGILKVYTQQRYIVTEIDCWAMGSRVCRFRGKQHKGEAAEA